MASYSTVKYGAKGSSVSQLQSLLNQNGFTLNVDGIFGDKTQAAVRDYQARMGLAVDGIVGTNTWGALTGSGSGSSGGVTGGSYGVGSGTYSPTGTSGYASIADGYAGAAPNYTASPEYQEALKLLKEYEANKPGEYSSQYQDQIDALLAQIQNRDPFSYDFNADPLYQQYKGNYMQLGQQAMMDTMGNAAAMTGGYGNSYASTAGNQAYQQYVQQVNNVIPQLRDAAYSMYRDEGQAMYDEMGLLRGLEDTAYGQYRDGYGDWLNERNYYYGKTGDLYNRDYGQYMDQYNMWAANRDFAYQSALDAQQQANWDKEYALAASKVTAGGSGGSGSSSGGTGKVKATAATDWDALLRDASNAQKQAILYGYTSEGKSYLQQIEKDLGKDGLNALRSKYGGSQYGGR